MMDVLMVSGDVPGGAGGDPGRDRTHAVREDPGAALQTDLQMCVQPALPGVVWEECMRCGG